MDKITLQRIETIHPILREELKEIYAEICKRLSGRVFCRFAYTLRTNAEQAEIYAQGRTKPGAIVTYAMPGQSYHNYGFAVDVVLVADKDGDGKYETASWDTKIDFDGDGQSDWEEIDFVFNMYGWKGLYKANGVRWDFPHFQKTMGYSIPTLQKLVAIKAVDANGYVILKP